MRGTTAGWLRPSPRSTSGVNPHLSAAVKNFVKDQVDAAVAEKDFYLSLTEMEIGHKVRISLIFLIGY